MTDRHIKGLAKQIALAVGAFFLASIIVIWSWNTLAVDLFGLVSIQFKHAVAIVLVLGLLRFAVSRASHRRVHDTLESS